MREEHLSFHARLEAYLDDEMDGTGRRAVEEHLRDCAECREELERSQQVRSALETKPAAEEPPSIWPAVHNRIRRERSPAYRAAMGLAVAASLLIGVLTGVTMRRAPIAGQAAATDELWTSLGSSLVESGSFVDYFAASSESEDR